MTGSTRINWAAIRFVEPEPGDVLDWTALQSARSRRDCRSGTALADGEAGALDAASPARAQTGMADRGAQVLARLYRLVHRMADQIEHRLEGREHSTPALAERESTAQILYQLTRAATGLLTMERQAGVTEPASDDEDSLAPDQAWAEIQRRLARLAAEGGAG